MTMDPLAFDLAAATRREELQRRAELMRQIAASRPRRTPRVRLRHRLAHALIALALWIDDAPRREPRLAGA